jgi:hypothetical protein
MAFDKLRQALGPELAPWLLALPLLVLTATLAEGLLQTFGRRQGYDWRAFAASMGDALGRHAVDLAGVSLATPVLVWAHAHRIQTLELSSPLAFALLFLGLEFFYYWYHRAAHRVRWFWATHAVHHSPNELTLAAALRLGWTGKLTGTGLFFAPLVWLGFPPTAVFAALGINLLYQFWLHAPWLPRLGALEWVLNTPIRLFALKGGMNWIAGKGNITIEAHKDKVKVTAKQKVTIKSTTESIFISAPTKVVVNGGGSFTEWSNAFMEEGIDAVPVPQPCNWVRKGYSTASEHLEEVQLGSSKALDEATGRSGAVTAAVTVAQAPWSPLHALAERLCYWPTFPEEWNSDCGQRRRESGHRTRGAAALGAETLSVESAHSTRPIRAACYVIDSNPTLNPIVVTPSPERANTVPPCIAATAFTIARPRPWFSPLLWRAASTR